MKIKVFQIDRNKDKERIRFESYKRTIEWAGKVDPEIYKKVWDAEFNIDGIDLNEIYYMLNLDEKPEGYAGTSLSVSDVFTIDDRSWFVDSFGFKEIDPEGFEPEKI